jgi:hypothetical protein
MEYLLSRLHYNAQLWFILWPNLKIHCLTTTAFSITSCMPAPELSCHMQILANLSELWKNICIITIPKPFQVIGKYVDKHTTYMVHKKVQNSWECTLLKLWNNSYNKRNLNCSRLRWLHSKHQLRIKILGSIQVQNKRLVSTFS